MLVKNSNIELQNRYTNETVIKNQLERMFDGFANDVIKALNSKSSLPIKH